MHEYHTEAHEPHYSPEKYFFINKEVWPNQWSHKEFQLFHFEKGHALLFEQAWILFIKWCLVPNLVRIFKYCQNNFAISLLTSRFNKKCLFCRIGTRIIRGIYSNYYRSANLGLSSRRRVVHHPSMVAASSSPHPVLASSHHQ